jgi:NitT/TauT family transport system substrate-binding protein
MTRREALRRLAGLVAAGAFGAAGCGPGGEGPAPGGGGRETVVRIGHFPNITHAQGVIAHGLSRKGKGWFEERLGPGVKVEWYVYNAGPTAMETIFAGSLDVTYVGPNPSLNAYMKSRGEEIRVIRGSAVGGSALVVQGDGPIRSPADFRGKKVATPQFGNTQDVACRQWLQKAGFKVTQTGGDVHVVPTQNPDQLALFKVGDVDAVWTVEPWVSRLILEAKGRIFLEEPDAVTTILVSSVRFLKERRDLAGKIARAQDELTAWIAKNPDEAMAVFSEEFEAETRGKMSPELLKTSWGRLKFDTAIPRAGLEKALADAREIGFVTSPVDLSRFVEEP